MRWFKSRLRKEVEEIRDTIGYPKAESDEKSYFSWFSYSPAPYTIAERLEILEEENRLLREYLGLEKYTTQQKTGYRKSAKGRKTT